MNTVTPTSTPPLTISLLGPMQVLVRGCPLPHLRSRKVLWLLALLTLRHGRLVEREWLAGTLWPDIDQSHAFANLRPVISELRRALSPESDRLRSPGRHSLLLDLVGAEVDTVTFDSGIASRNPVAWEAAVALYRGPLLEGCTEEWIFQERSEREQTCLQTLQKLADLAFIATDYKAAIHYYQRAVHIDPLWEGARRGLMEALAKSGDRNAALGVYRKFVELLKNDPTAVPDKRTVELYAALRTEGRERATTPVAVPAKQATITAITGYLPHALTGLIGR